jgi:hypothetical protein
MRKSAIICVTFLLPMLASANPGESCSSDFSCGMGEKCFKGYLQSTGTCARSVNEHGTTEYNGKSADSIGPKMNTKGMCQFTGDCPIGFTCEKEGYSSYGYCAKK